MRIAVLLTVFNRKEKTLNCLGDLMSQDLPDGVNMDIFLVDGGSGDGTPDAVRECFPSVHCVVKPGLYWAGGMRAAWAEAISHCPDYDFFWLVNDDVSISSGALNSFLEADVHSKIRYGSGGVYVGSFRDSKTGNWTYGGRLLIKAGRSSSRALVPDGSFQACDLGNANLMLVSREVYDSIGGLSEDFTHGLADYDYTLRTRAAGLPCLVLPGYSGICDYDHGNNWCDGTKSLKQRIAYLKSPKGLAYKEYMKYVSSHFPVEVVPSFFKLWVKTLVPSIWDRFKNTTRHE